MVYGFDCTLSSLGFVLSTTSQSTTWHLKLPHHGSVKLDKKSCRYSEDTLDGIAGTNKSTAAIEL